MYRKVRGECIIRAQRKFNNFRVRSYKILGGLGSLTPE